jgi:predicted choloylglycine hydrolase
MKEMLLALLRSRKFWLAVIAVVQTIVFQFYPEFPPAMWQAIDGLLAVLIAGIAIEDAAEKSGNVTQNHYYPDPSPTPPTDAQVG